MTVKGFAVQGMAKGRKYRAAFLDAERTRFIVHGTKAKNEVSETPFIHDPKDLVKDVQAEEPWTSNARVIIFPGTYDSGDKSSSLIGKGMPLQDWLKLPVQAGLMASEVAGVRPA